MVIPDPRIAIDDEIAKFDSEEAIVEDTVRALLVALPNNREFTHVHLKVIGINQLYRARVLNIDAEPLARHIWSLNLDRILSSGSPEAVTLIHGCKTTRNKYYSFATKFCSWHNQEAYSLWDYNVDEALWSYKRKDGFAKFKRQELLKYSRLVEIVKEFREFYGLQRHSLKNIDKFLWRVGATIL
jgi:hypothetical protein